MGRVIKYLGHMTCLWGMLCGAFGAQRAQAQSVHHSVDKDGVVHIWNVRGRSNHHAKLGTTSSSPSSPIPMALLEAVIAESASLYKIPQALVKAVIATESNYNASAVSEKGAIGLMQLMPQTAKDMYVEDPFDPVQNIYGGTRYLRVLVNQFGGDFVKVVAAYNAGPEVVRRQPTKAVPDIPETQEYVRRVLLNYQSFRTAETPATTTLVPETTDREEGAPSSSHARG